jgi:hypothetical protein
MKRGLITWDRGELPAAAFDARLSALYQLAADFDVPAIVAYSDVCRSNDVRYISNFMPYWNRALTVVPRGEKPILLCALSPRVYPWIKSVTIHETILPSPSLPAQLVKLCGEKGWAKVGMIDQSHRHRVGNRDAPSWRKARSRPGGVGSDARGHWSHRL